MALKALTLWAAYQHFEDKRKGNIVVGKLADFVVLSGNPLTVEREKLADLKVVETIKQGRTIWKREDATAPLSCMESASCFEAYVRFHARLETRQRCMTAVGE